MGLRRRIAGAGRRGAVAVAALAAGLTAIPALGRTTPASAAEWGVAVAALAAGWVAARVVERRGGLLAPPASRQL
jgi:hypothetical protein